jgi:hypothetical protein
MTTLTIHDLQESKQLDSAARTAIYGGVNDWIATYRPQSASSLRGAIIGQLNINNYLLVNPVFNMLNQYEFVNIDVAQNFNSAINVLVDQSNAGSNGTPSAPAIPAF